MKLGSEKAKAGLEEGLHTPKRGRYKIKIAGSHASWFNNGEAAEEALDKMDQFGYKLAFFSVSGWDIVFIFERKPWWWRLWHRITCC